MTPIADRGDVQFRKNYNNNRKVRNEERGRQPDMVIEIVRITVAKYTQRQPMVGPLTMS